MKILLDLIDTKNLLSLVLWCFVAGVMIFPRLKFVGNKVQIFVQIAFAGGVTLLLLKEFGPFFVILGVLSLFFEWLFLFVFTVRSRLVFVLILVFLCFTAFLASLGFNAYAEYSATVLYVLSFFAGLRSLLYEKIFEN